jgi:hypothetical protein
MQSRNHGDRSTADWGRGRDQILPPLFVGRLLGRQILHNLLRQLLRGHVRGVTFRQNAVFWVGKDAVPKLVLL